MVTPLVKGSVGSYGLALSLLFTVSQLNNEITFL